MGKYSNKNKKRKDNRNGGNRHNSNRHNSNKNDSRDNRNGPPRVKEMRSDRMVAYYTYQNVFGHGTKVSKEEDRKSFLEASCRPLNASFRITKLATPEFKEQFTARMQEILGSDGQITITYDTPSGKAVRKLKPPQPIPFIENGWMLDVDRSTIRKNKGLKSFFEFLMVASDSGLITRQETVSMVPPVALSIEPHHLVLDTCAAPGSKTCQILENVSLGSGWVMANDVNVSRAHMLVHQCKRINSPSLVVVTHAGQEMPMPKTFRNDGEGNEGWADRVLCDVPCTGDGTMRKNAGIFRKWSVNQQNNIHKIQLDIALRGVRQCKVGGLVVYSTCSMSPMENEAVVAQIIRETGYAVEVEECRELSEKGFSCRGGMTTWKVMDDRDATRRHFGEVIEDKPRFKKGGWDHQERQVKAGDDDGGESRPAKKAKVEGQEGDKEDPCGETKAAEEAKREPKNGKMSEDGTYIIPVYDDSPEKWSSESMIADCNKEGLWEFKTHSDVPSHLTASIPKGLFPPTPAEASRMGLEKCMRIMPQDMDTGGFFVTESSGGGGQKDSKQHNPNQEIIPLSPALTSSLVDFYGLSGAPLSCFFARTHTAKGIMYLHPSVLSHLASDDRGQYKLVHSGVQVFEKNSKNLSLVPYRIHQDGVRYAAPYMNKRKIQLSNRDYCTLVRAGIERKENQLRTCMLEEATRKELQGVRSRMEGEMRWDPRDVLEEEWFGRDRTKDKEGKGKGEEEEKEEKGKEEDEEDTKA
ncbi:hypothetical protein TrRE_jg11172 [Triparma retinervis]|uniref:SAM-dependent MTase RsmB/NOP-type domain-containing protein n=1 Tax=Triparma retinervis TaxID=2557542 RepID=A0A9W6ZLI9_9STRA|nr:hypothetical protein TrRE_jg11172 [Triparma retinervis]